MLMNPRATSNYDSHRALRHGIGVFVIDRAYQCVPHRSPARRVYQRGRIMLESLVLENDDIAGVQLLFEYRRACLSPVVGDVGRGIEVGFRARRPIRSRT